MLKVALQNNLLTLCGALDQHTVMSAWPKQQQVLSHLSGQALSLDLLGLEHIDTAGLAWLVDLYSQAKKAQVDIETIKAPSALHKLAKISDLQALLPLQ